MDINYIGKRAKAASRIVATLGTEDKNKALLTCAEYLIQDTDKIVAENAKDVEKAKTNGMSEGLLDRLMLNDKRVAAMADGLRKLAALPDPVGGVSEMIKRPNGLLIGKKRVPLGVILMIYEARPNVTSDAFGICFKSGNACILRGGSDAFYSTMAISNTLRDALSSCQISPDAVINVEDTTHETVNALMKLNQYIDVVIPRGGAGLIKSCVANSTVPVIETGTGNCHIFVDESADQDSAVKIIINAKTQRLGVCNACESLVIHRNIANEFIPKIYKALSECKVEIRADEEACSIVPEMTLATEEDYGREYLDRIISLKIVDDIYAAIDHINKYNTGHSESIITRDYNNSQLFLDRIDAAAVYVNASTRFTDGDEFGLGAEIGISTQKLHARGPMGLYEMTTYKYIIYGEGQIR